MLFGLRKIHSFKVMHHCLVLIVFILGSSVTVYSVSLVEMLIFRRVRHLTAVYMM